MNPSLNSPKGLTEGASYAMHYGGGVFTKEGVFSLPPTIYGGIGFILPIKSLHEKPESQQELIGKIANSLVDGGSYSKAEEEIRRYFVKISQTRRSVHATLKDDFKDISANGRGVGRLMRYHPDRLEWELKHIAKTAYTIDKHVVLKAYSPLVGLKAFIDFLYPSRRLDIAIPDRLEKPSSEPIGYRIKKVTGDNGSKIEVVPFTGNTETSNGEIVVVRFRSSKDTEGKDNLVDFLRQSHSNVSLLSIEDMLSTSS
ncbi:hypothetical protein J4204_00570 [Candidatus Woesearchaeota archaeon]|nr:hypothetical protein [Candidatus Woesearchaeota archaeon]